MTKWTQEQKDLLIQCHQLGAKACRDLIRKQCNANHSIDAVAKQAQRMGYTIKKNPTPCPRCGSTIDIQASGYCVACHNENLVAEKYASFRDIPTLDFEHRKKRARREYNRIRQQVLRQKKKPNY